MRFILNSWHFSQVTPCRSWWVYHTSCPFSKYFSSVTEEELHRLLLFRFRLDTSVALARSILPLAFLDLLKSAFIVFKHCVHFHFIAGLHFLGKEIGLTLKGHSILTRYITTPSHLFIEQWLSVRWQDWPDSQERGRKNCLVAILARQKEPLKQRFLEGSPSILFCHWFLHCFLPYLFSYPCRFLSLRLMPACDLMQSPCFLVSEHCFPKSSIASKKG